MRMKQELNRRYGEIKEVAPLDLKIKMNRLDGGTGKICRSLFRGRNLNAWSEFGKLFCESVNPDPNDPKSVMLYALYRGQTEELARADLMDDFGTR